MHVQNHQILQYAPSHYHFSQRNHEAANSLKKKKRNFYHPIVDKSLEIFHLGNRESFSGHVNLLWKLNNNENVFFGVEETKTLAFLN